MSTFFCKYQHPALGLIYYRVNANQCTEIQDESSFASIIHYEHLGETVRDNIAKATPVTEAEFEAYWIQTLDRLRTSLNPAPETVPPIEATWEPCEHCGASLDDHSPVTKYCPSPLNGYSLERYQAPKKEVIYE